MKLSKAQRAVLVRMAEGVLLLENTFRWRYHLVRSGRVAESTFNVLKRNAWIERIERESMFNHNNHYTITAAGLAALEE